MSSAVTSSSPRISLSRPVYTQKRFNAEFCATDPPAEQPCCPPNDLGATLLSFFPFVEVLRTYQWKSHLWRDAVAGCTVACMHIPLGMAFGQLSDLTPIFGLYTSLFPALIYSLFATSRHVSFGTQSIMSLMMAKAIQNEMLISGPAAVFSGNGTDGQLATVEGELQYKLSIAVLVTFLVGIFQLLFGALQLGVVAVYLSTPVISGFTCGCGFHAFISQAKLMFGIDIPSHNGAFKILLTIRDIVLNLSKTNYVTLLLTITCFTLLTLFKELVNPAVKKKLKAPLPAELFLILLATGVSAILQLATQYNVAVVGDIPSGIPTPSVPFRLRPTGGILLDSVSIAVVSFAITMSMAKLIAKQGNYKVRPNQELLSMGLANSVASFFSCFTASASMSRSLVQRGVGGKTQVAGLFSALIMILVLLWIGPLFGHLPKCTLAAVIIVNQKTLFLQLLDPPKLWILAPLDAMVWMVTFLVTVVVDVDFGLFAGVLCLLLTVIWREARLSPLTLSPSPDTELYVSATDHTNLEKLPANIHVLRPCRALHFSTSLRFTETVQNCIRDKQEPQYVVVDCSAWSYIDTTGLATLHDTMDLLQSAGHCLILSHISTSLWRSLIKFDPGDETWQNKIFTTTHDAVHYLETGKCQQTDVDLLEVVGEDLVEQSWTHVGGGDATLRS